MAELVTRDGVRLRYQQTGSGRPALVFIHGWSCDRSFFAPQIAHFGDRHAVVAIDMRGHGESGHPGPGQGGYTIDEMADDVLAVVGAAGLRQPVLVGHSSGAVIGLSCAATSADVGGVVLVDPAPIVAERSRAHFRDAHDTIVADSDGSWRRAFVERMFLPTDVAGRSSIVAIMSSFPPAIAATTLRALGEYDAVGALAAVEVPVLSIGSAIPSDSAADLRAVCPSITIGQTVGSGHFIQLEVPDQVNAMIERWLATTWPSGGALTVRAAEPGDAEWVRAVLEKAWGSVLVARRNELLDATSYPGFVASIDGERAGLAVYCQRGDEYEILSVSSAVERAGVGRALMRQCLGDAATRGCRRVWLTTTNNNVRAISFYQQVGMSMCAIHLGAVADARRLKPTISRHDQAGVAIEHELEFEMLLG